MQNFHNYLETKRIVPKKRIPFYINWVSEVFNFHDKNANDKITSEEIDQFLKHLTKRKEDWQVDQASDAIRIYQFYKSHTNKPLTDHNKNSDDQWKVIADEMKNILRLKQLSMATEKIYLYWIRMFYRFLKGASPFSLDDTHVKNFLTYLAVDRHVAPSTQNQAFNALLCNISIILGKTLIQ